MLHRQAQFNNINSLLQACSFLWKGERVSIASLRVRVYVWYMKEYAEGRHKGILCATFVTPKGKTSSERKRTSETPGSWGLLTGHTNLVTPPNEFR